MQNLSSNNTASTMLLQYDTTIGTEAIDSASETIPAEGNRMEMFWQKIRERFVFINMLKKMDSIITWLRASAVRTRQEDTRGPGRISHVDNEGGSEMDINVGSDSDAGN